MSNFILRFPCDQKNAWRSGKALFTLCYSDIQNRVADTNFFTIIIITVCNEIFALFHIVTSSIFSQIRKLNFDYCWCIDMFYYPTFLIHRNYLTDLRYRWVLFKMKPFVQNYLKNGWMERNIFFRIRNFIRYIQI